MNEMSIAVAYQDNVLTLETQETSLSPISKALALNYSLPMTYITQYAEALNDVVLGWFVSYFQAACEPNEEIVLSDADVFEETCLSKHQWYKIRKTLIEKGFLRCRKQGRQAFYSLDEDNIELALRQVQNMLAPVIDINRLIAKTLIHQQGLSIKSVILFAYFIQNLPYLNMAERTEDSPPTLFCQDAIVADTFLSKAEIKAAVRDLKKLNLITIGHQRDKDFVVLHMGVLGKLTAQYCQLHLGGDENAAC